MTPSAVERSWMPRLEKSVQVILDWYEGPDLLEVLPGSILSQDDLRWPSRPLGMIARNQIMHAIEALRTCVDVFLTADGPTLTSVGVSPMTRTVLMAASQAFWVVAPDDADARLVRGLRMAVEELHHEKQWITTLLESKDSLLVDEGRKEYARTYLPKLKQDLAETTKKLNRIGFYKPSVKQQKWVMTALPNVTETINELARSITQKDPRLAVDFRLEWRASSGNSHGKAWQAVWGPHAEVLFTDETETEIAQVRPNPSIVTMTAPLELAVFATDIAIRRYRALARTPAGP